MTRRHVVAALLGVFCVLPIRAAESPPLELVVMVRASRGPGTPVESGAGLIVSQTDARTVIATALHIVRDEEQTNASHIAVEFSTLRGEDFPATMALRYFDAKSDLAVLFIDHAKVAAVPRLSEARFAHAVSPSPADKLVGVAVSVVGATGRTWAIGPTGDTVTRVVDSKLRVKSAVAGPGASGGAAFDAFGRLLGMNSSVDSESGELVVVPMATIRRQLEGWGIEYALGNAGAPTGSNELLDALRRTTRVDGRAMPGGDTYAISVAVPDALAALKPTFRVVFPEMMTLPPAQLRTPDWFAQLSLPPERLKVQLWMDTPDGRTTGPVLQVLDVAALAAARIEEKAARVRASQTEANRDADPGSRERKVAGEEAYFRAMEQARLENSRADHRRMEQNARASAAKQAELTASLDRDAATYFATDLLERIVRDFPGWSLNCRSVTVPTREAIEKSLRSGEPPQQSWRCDRPQMLGRVPHRGRIDAVVYSMRLGESGRRLNVDVPVDHSVIDVDSFIQRVVERMLSEGKGAIHVEVALTDGRRLGPKELCAVVRRGPSSLLLECAPAAGRR